MIVASSGEGILHVRLNRPAVLNAVDRDVVTQLLSVFDGAAGGVIVLGSTQERAFCSGADITMSDPERAAVSDMLYELYERMLRSDALVFVAARGHLVGAGAQMALAADLRLGSSDTAFRFVGPRFGLAVGTWGLPSLVGRGRAMEACLTGRRIGGEEAERIGLLDRLCADPGSTALELARKAREVDPDARRRLKRLIVEGTHLFEALRRERLENQAGWSGSVVAR